MKPVLIFDGDCGFCRMWVEHWRVLTGDRVEYRPFQEAAKDYPQIPLDEFRTSMKLVLPDGKRFAAAEAAFHLYEFAGRPRLLWPYRHWPLFAPVSELVYKLVGTCRVCAAKFTRIFFPRVYRDYQKCETRH